MASEVKWIKITTDIFDDEKMALIDSMPERDAVMVIWFKLLCMAGRLNNGGVFMLNGKMTFTDEMLAAIFHRPLNTVRLALQTFEQFEMVDIVNNTYTIPNWDKHQSFDKLEIAREKTRQRVATHREKQRLLAESNVTVTLRNADVTQTDIDIEEDKDIDIDIDNKKENITCKQVVDLYHSICISYPKIRSISAARQKAIKARLNTYTLDDFKAVFENAEASSFLKGKNDRNWTANFDWLMTDSKFVKVLEGSYADKGKKEKLPGWFQSGAAGYLGEAELEAIHRELNSDPDFQKERDQLAQELQAFGRKV